MKTKKNKPTKISKQSNNFELFLKSSKPIIKQTKYSKSKQSRNSNQANFKTSQIIRQFYSLHNTIQSHLITYTDPQSKRLYRTGLQNIVLTAPYSWPEIDSIITTIDNSYKVQRNILSQLKLDKPPKSVQYATEDMTRGLSKFIATRYARTLPNITISNAFIKMWEILSTFDLIPASTRSFRIFHIAEAPGQMILACKYYAERKCSSLDISNYDWRANSLNPFNPLVKAKYGNVLGDAYGLIKGNPKRWLWGADNTGDITQPANIEWFRNYISQKWISSEPDKHKHKPNQQKLDSSKLDLIVGDGGFGSGNDAIILQRIDLGQVITVLACSASGGSCVIKHFTPYMTNHPETIKATGFFISFIYLYYLAFEDVSLFKPYSSDMISGEFYVIGKGFRGIDSSVLKRLYKILDNFEVNNAVIAKEDIPETFIFQIMDFIETMTKYNIQGIEKSNLLLTCITENRNSEESGKDKTKVNKTKIINKVLRCDDFLDEDKIESILVPRYNQWIKLYKFI